MKAKILSLLAIAICLVTPARAQRANADESFLQAVSLYRSGMYERARTLFESCSDDPVARGYSVLCAMRMQAPDADALFDAYQQEYKSSPMNAEMNYRQALRKFDEGEFELASELFSKVPMKEIPALEQTAAIFKMGYCDYTKGLFDSARKRFRKVESGNYNDYTSTARYLLGYMDYQDRSFAEAAKWFRQSASDPRFKDLSEFYLVDCEFNLKNYDYVIEKGVEMFENVDVERRERLARSLSEAFLVKGDKANALKYYKSVSRENMSRSDYFYAGSMLFAVEDWKGAVENYSRMTDRTDSLGQIANYQMAGSFIKLHNNVAAMDAFKAAADRSFDKKIQEDAFFNYAKLAFDLNKDPKGFTDYISRWSTKEKGDQIYEYMALAALVNKDYAAAVDAYDHIDELTPEMQSNYTKANYLRAGQLISNGAWRDALGCLRTSAYYLPKTDRFNQLSRYWIAECQYNTDNFSAARETYVDLYNGSALDGIPEGNVLPYNIAYCCYREEDWAAAAKWFDNYIQSGVHNYREDALTRRADCDFARRDYKNAVKTYQTVIDAFGSPDNIYPYYQQALSYGLSGDKKKKAAVLSTVLKASPAAPMYAEAMYELGRSQMDIKDDASALETFKLLRKTTSDSTYVAKSLIGMGMVHRNSKEYEAALGDYKKVVSMMPGSSYAEDALLAIESIYQSMRQPEKYLEYIEQNRLGAKKSAAEREDMYFNTAEQVFLGGDSQQSISVLQKYLDEFPEGTKNAQAWFYLAESYKAQGAKEKAADAYAQAMALASEGSYAESSRLGFANICYSLERYEDAYRGFSELGEIARIETNKTNARTGMMRSAFRARNYDNAISAAKEVEDDLKSSAEVRREARYVQAKSYMLTSRRGEAMEMFRALAKEPSTAEGAEARYIIIQNMYDTGDFQSVENAVYDFSASAGDQSYWLAKAFITLGDSFIERGLSDQAKATFESIRDGYEPQSQSDDVQENVKLRLQRLAAK